METLLVIASPRARRGPWREFALALAERLGHVAPIVLALDERHAKRTTGHFPLPSGPERDAGASAELQRKIELEWKVASGFEDVVLIGIDGPGLRLGEAFLAAHRRRRPWARRVSRVVLARDGDVRTPSLRGDRRRAKLLLELLALGRDRRANAPALFLEGLEGLDGLSPHEHRRVLQHSPENAPRPRRVLWLFGRGRGAEAVAGAVRDALVDGSGASSAGGGATRFEPVPTPGPLGILTRGDRHSELDDVASRYARLVRRWPGVEHVALAHGEGAWFASRLSQHLPGISFARTWLSAAWLPHLLEPGRLPVERLGSLHAVGVRADARSGLIGRALGSLGRPVGDAGRRGFASTLPSLEAQQLLAGDERELARDARVREALNFLLHARRPPQSLEGSRDLVVAQDVIEAHAPRWRITHRVAAALAGLLGPLLVTLAVLVLAWLAIKRLG